MSEIVIQTRQQRLIIDPPTRTVAIVSTGPVGPPGPTGATGPTGPQGVPGSLYLARNRIINGGFDVWQRGAGPWTTNDSYTADQWINGLISDSTASYTRQILTPGAIPGYEPSYHLRSVVTAGTTAASMVRLNQRIESVRTFAGQTVTLSFWAKANAVKSVGIELMQNFGVGGTPSNAVTSIGATKIELSTTWTRYTVAGIVVPSITGKTLGTTHDGALWLNIYMDAGSDYSARTGGLGHQSGTFDFWGIQLEAGESASAFEVKPYGDTLRDCLRYYWRFGPGIKWVFGHLGTFATSYTGLNLFPVPMRATPVVYITETTARDNKIGVYTASGARVVVTVAYNTITYQGYTLQVTGGVYIYGDASQYMEAVAEL